MQKNNEYKSNDGTGQSLDITEAPTGEYPVLAENSTLAGDVNGTAEIKAPPIPSTTPRDAEKASFWLAHLEGEVTRLHAKWQNIDAEFKNREARTAELQREIEARDATIAALRGDAQREAEVLKAANEHIMAKAGELDVLAASKRAGDERIAALAAELADAEVARKTALAETDSARADAANLKESLSEARAASSAAAERNEQLLAEQNKLRISLQDLETYIDGRHSRWAELNSELAEHKEKVVNLEGVIKTRDSEKATQENEKAQLAVRIQDLERQCSELAGRRKERESAYDDLQTKLSAHLAQMEQLKLEHSSRAKDLEQAASTTADAQRQIESLTKELEGRKENIDALSAALSAATAASADAKTANQALTARVAELEKALAERSSEVEVSLDNLRTSREQMSSIRQQLADRTQELAASQESANQKGRQVEQLTHELQALRDEAVRVRDEIAALEKHSAEIGHQRTDAIVDQKRLEYELAAEREQVASLKAELGAKQIAADLLERSVGRITDLGASLAALDAEMHVGPSDGGFKLPKPSHEVTDFAATIANDDADDADDARAPLDDDLLPIEVPPIDTLLNDDKPRPSTKRSASENRRKLVMMVGGKPIDYPIVKNPMTIGRGLECDIRIASHFVSRVHARISTKGATTIIEDVGSKNGILVNSDRVLRGLLRNGDVVSLGGELHLKFVELAS